MNGVIALMGSGELAGTMVETHKALLARYGSRGKALFLDTPAGFQLNVDQIGQRAREYFARRVGHSLEIASFKCRETASREDAEKAYRALGEADFVLIGPGSPTYTVRQLADTPVPSLLGTMVGRGGCLVAASAAALTIGSHTLPVYEIYKVGEAPRWVEGLNLLKILGRDLVVIPHWNNAEGGNHDTRFCYMGESRFRILEGMLPEGAYILGIDEHTACILEFSSRTVSVQGVGSITLRCRGRERVFARGERVSFEDFLRTGDPLIRSGRGAVPPIDDGISEEQRPFWHSVLQLEKSFCEGIETRDWTGAASLLLEMDRLLWQAHVEGESPEVISQAREVFREMVVHIGARRDQSDLSPEGDFARLVRELLSLREDYRLAKKWEESDAIRRCLKRAGVVITDSENGPQWRTGGTSPA